MLSRMLPSLIEWLFLPIGAVKQPGEVPVNAPGGGGLCNVATVCPQTVDAFCWKHNKYMTIF